MAAKPDSPSRRYLLEPSAWSAGLASALREVDPAADVVSGLPDESATGSDTAELVFVSGDARAPWPASLALPLIVVGIGTAPDLARDVPALLLSELPSDTRTEAELLESATAHPGAKTITWNALGAIANRLDVLAEEIVAFADEVATTQSPLPMDPPSAGTPGQATLADGATLGYTKFGEGERVIITAQLEFPQEPNYASELAKTVPDSRVYQVTLRGFRPSSLAATDLGLGWLTRWAHDVAEFATLMGADRFIYTGGSHGGGVGWYLAALHPERLTAYVGVVSGPHDREGDTTSSPVRRELTTRWQDAELVRHNMEHRVFGPPTHAYRAERRAALLEATVAGHVAMLPEEARINQGKPWPDAKDDDELAAELRRIRVPTLLLSGAQDVIITAKASLRSASSVPNAKMVLWQDEGHMTWEEEPRRTAVEVARYVRQLGL